MAGLDGITAGKVSGTNRALRSLIHRLASATEPSTLARDAADGARETLNARGAYIERPRADLQRIEVVGAAGDGAPTVGTLRDPSTSAKPECADCATLKTPLRVDSRTLGSLVVLRSAEQGEFSEEDVDSASIIADAIAMGMALVDLIAHERHAREQLATTLGTLTDGFLSVDGAQRIRFVNRAAQQALGADPRLDPRALIGQWLPELLPRAWRAQIEGEMRRACDERTSIRLEQHLGPPDRWFAMTMHPSAEQLTIFIRDITDEKRAETALRQSEWRQTILADTGQLLETTLGFEATMNRIAHLVVRWLCDWCTIYVPVPGGARRAALAARDPQTELLVRRAVGGFHSESLETPIDRVLRTGRSTVLTHVARGILEAAGSDSDDYARLLREHTPRSIIVVPLVARGHTVAALALVSTSEERPFNAGDLSLAEEIARRAALALDGAKLYEDAMQRALAESALRKAAAAVTARLSVDPVIQDVASNALIALDASGAFVERVDESTKRAIVVATAGDRVPPNDASTPYDGSFAKHVVESGHAERIDDLGAPGRLVPKVLTTQCRGCPGLVVPLLREEAHGALFFIRAPGAPEFSDDEIERASIFAELAGIAFRKAYILEIAERRRTDAEAATRERDEILAVVSHDLRNPLHTIGMAASLLDDEALALDSKQHHEQCAIIKRSSARMGRLIQDLLDVSRIESGHFAVKVACEDPLHIAEEALGAFASTADARGLRLRSDFRPAAQEVEADRDRLLQVLGNFLDNALKFSARGSEVVLSVAPDADGVRFSVRDNGPGIAAGSLPHVFDRHWQERSTAHEGAGLGLAIAKGIATAHGGRVWAESVLGDGSTFSLWVPYSASCPSPAAG